MTFDDNSLWTQRSRFCWPLAKATPLVFLFVTVGCLQSRNLTGGYFLNMSGCEAQVIQSQGKSVVVAGNVQSYAVRGQYITGYADTTCIDPKTEPEARAGYFFIDTRNGQIMQALTEEQWKDELRALGWNNPNLNTVRTTKELRPPNSSAN